MTCIFKCVMSLQLNGQTGWKTDKRWGRSTGSTTETDRDRRLYFHMNCWDYSLRTVLLFQDVHRSHSRNQWQQHVSLRGRVFGTLSGQIKQSVREAAVSLTKAAGRPEQAARGWGRCSITGHNPCENTTNRQTDNTHRREKARKKCADELMAQHSPPWWGWITFKSWK